MTKEAVQVDLSSVQDRVYARILDDMRKGVFTPGQVLSIRALAERFGTSEMPVREAIKRLIAEKALSQRPDRSFQVPVITPVTFQEMLLVRNMIEGRATELATAQADAVLIGKLRRMNREMERAISKSDLPNTLEANEEFHFLIYNACNNAILQELIEILWLRSGPYLAGLAADESGIAAFSDAVRSHDMIIAAMAENRPADAARALQLDIETTARWYLARESDAANEDAEPAAPSFTRRRKAKAR